MRKTYMIAECLRRHAWWRLNRADESDQGRHARTAVALLNAAAYTADLPDEAVIIARILAAGHFSDGEFRLGEQAERLVRFWHYDAPGGTPADLLEAIASLADRPLVPAQRDGGQPLCR